MKSKKNTLAKNIAVVFISFVITLLFSELIIRILYKDKIVLFPRYMTNATYGNFSIRCVRPNTKYKHRSIDGVFHFQTNNRGFRNNENIDYAKKPDEVRILCLGDSHTEGYEVNQEETFSFISEKILRQNGLNATVINAGVSGFSTSEELVFLENEGYKYNPDFVVLGFFGNDISDNIKSSIFYLNHDSLDVFKFTHLPGVKIQNTIYKFGIFHFLGENSYLYAFAFNTVWNHFNRTSQEKNKKVQTEYAIAGKQDYSEYQLQLSRKILARMYNFTLQRDIQFIILDIPIYPVGSSIPETMIDFFRENSDTTFYCEDMQDEYASLFKTHLPNGHHHISTETHSLFGQKISDYVKSKHKSTD